MALAGPGLGAEAALHAAGAHARRRAARLRVAGAAALGGAVAVAARLHALGLAALLGEVRRPGGVAEPALLVAAREVEQLVERARVEVDVGRGVADRAQPLRHVVDPEVARLGVRDLVPRERARHARVRRRPDGVAGGDGAVARVLVVVDEHAVALLLPPLGGGQVGGAALHLARHRQRRPAHLEEVPLRLDPHVDVDPLRARGLGVAAQPVLGQHVAHHHRRPPHRVPGDPRRRIEVDAQLVGMVEVAAARRPRVEVDDAEVDGPDEVGLVVGHELLGGAPGREVDGRGLEPVRHLLRHALLPDGLFHDPVDEALHDRRALANVHEHGIGGGHVVLGEVELRPAGLGEVDLGRVGEAHLSPGQVERRELAPGHCPERSCARAW